MRYLPTPEQTGRLTPEELRTHFLVSGLFVPGESRFEMVDLDRVTLGGVVPLATPITLEAPELFAAKSFTERRELGILNIGGAGLAHVDGATHQLAKRDMLYVGRGAHEIVLRQRRRARAGVFFLVSYPAHAELPRRASGRPRPTRRSSARKSERTDVGWRATSTPAACAARSS